MNQYYATYNAEAAEHAEDLHRLSLRAQRALR